MADLVALCFRGSLKCMDMYVLIVTNRIFSRYLMDVFESLNRGDDVIWVGEGDYCIG